jgi:hypothetical protein
MKLHNFTQETSDRQALPEAYRLKYNPDENAKKSLSRESLVSLLFLIGSLIFTLDAILENLKGVSFSSLLHISASVLFTIGSFLFLPNERSKNL